MLGIGKIVGMLSVIGIIKSTAAPIGAKLRGLPVG